MQLFSSVKGTLLVLLFLLVSSNWVNAGSVSTCTNISYSGTWTLANSISGSTNAFCFNISANDVTFDCQGYTIDGIDGGGSNGIFGTNALGQYTNNTVIKNCILTDWVVAVTLGGYNSTFQNITVSSCGTNSFQVIANDNTTMDECYAYNGAGRGLQVLSGTNLLVKNSVFENTTSYGFESRAGATGIMNNVTFKNNTYAGYCHKTGVSNICNYTIENSTILTPTIFDFWVENDSEVWLANTTFNVSSFRFNDTAKLFKKDLVRFNFTLSDGTPQASNFQLNSTLLGVVLNDTAPAGGVTGTYPFIQTKVNSTSSYSYNDYTINAHPNVASYEINTSILTFLTSGTWNLTFYSSAPPPNPNAPTITAPTITPATADLTDTLICNNGTFSDLDGDSESAVFYGWYKNDQPLTFVPDANTLFYFPMDEMRGAISKDATNKYNGTLKNFAPDADLNIYNGWDKMREKWVFTPQACISAGCMNFSGNGTNSSYSKHIMVNNTDFNLDTFTIEGWFVFNGIRGTADANQYLMAKDTAVTGYRQWFVRYNSDTNAMSFIAFNTTSSTGNYVSAVNPTVTIENASIVGQKLFISAVYNDSGNVAIYVYNETGLVGKDTQTIDTPIMLANNIEITLGARGVGGSFNGTADDFRYFNNARTEAQIALDWKGPNESTLDLTTVQNLLAGDWFNCSQISQDNASAPKNSSKMISTFRGISQKSNFFAKGVNHVHQYLYQSPIPVLWKYREYEYDWVSITEHTYRYDLEDYYFAEQDMTGFFTNIAGEEWSHVAQKHITLMNISANQSLTDDQATINNVTGSPNYGVAVLAHPTAGSFWSWAQVSAVDNYTGIELYRGDNYREQIFNNASMQAPEKLRAPFGVDDMHFMSDSLGMGWIKVWIDGTMTKQKIVEGIRAKNFYAVNGNWNNSNWMEMDSNPFKLNGYLMGSTQTNNTINISFTINASETINRIEIFFTNITAVTTLYLNTSCGASTCAISYTNTTPLYNGSYRIRANTSTATLWSSPIYVQTSYSPVFAPVVQSISLTQKGATCTALPSPVTIGYSFGCKANVTDADNSTISNLYMKLYLNGSEVDNYTFSNVASGSNQCWSPTITWNSTKSDSWLCEAYAFDGANNSTLVNSSAITVNNTAPVMAITLTSNETRALNTSLLSCNNGTYSDADGDLINDTATVTWYLNNTIHPNTGWTFDVANYSLNTTDFVNCSVNFSDTGYDMKTVTSYSSAQTIQEQAVFSLQVFDEISLDQIYFSVTMFNSTNTKTGTYVFNYTPTLNEVPIGFVQLDLTNSSDYYQRTIYLTLEADSNYTLQAYLLPKTASAKSVSFYVQTTNGNPVSNALITIKRRINDTWTTVGQKYSDATGISNFIMDSTSQYQIVASASGYAEFTTTITPSESSYSITLQTSGQLVGLEQTYYDIQWFYGPQGRLNTNLAHNFTYTTQSSNDSIVWTAWKIYNGTTLVHEENQTGSNGTTLNYSFTPGTDANISIYFLVMRQNMSDQMLGVQYVIIPLYTFAEYITGAKNLTSILRDVGAQTTTPGGISAFTIILVTIAVSVLVSGWVNQFSPTGAQLAFLVVMGLGSFMGVGMLASGLIMLICIMVIVGYNIIRFGG